MSEVITHIETQKKTDVFFNPFPGLRPFGVEESHLFFGREGQSDEVLRKLAENKFVAVIGASGSGKSSLMYCGLIPTLHGGFITEAGAKWRVITSRPGRGPIDNLAQAIVDSEVAQGVISESDTDVQLSVASTVLRSSTLGLIEALSRIKRKPGENILLLVDQFEELFRFKRSSEDTSAINESAAFVKLLLEAVNQSDIPVYVVMTMRSDFIGDCAQFSELTQYINDSHYLIPQMTREDMRDAIVGPVAVGGGQITTRLVQQLLNDVGDNQDQLPILQHAMMRTWNYWVDNRDENEAVDIHHYESIGKLEKALSQHANEAYDQLNERERVVCESIFKALTEKGGDNRGIRHPTPVEDLALIARATVEEVLVVSNHFRQAGRSFLTPSYEIPIDDQSIIDISHESLMRIWDRLKSWVDEEAQAVQMYLRLSEAAALYQSGKTNLWRPPDLQLALQWRDKQNPTLPWAKRYDPAFERAMVFLETSEKAHLTEEENKIKLQKRALRRTRVFALVMGVLMILVLGALLWSVVQQREAVKARNDAEKSSEEARLAQLEAEEEKRNADIAKEDALVQKELALEQKRLADLAKEDAIQQQERAERQTILAREQTLIAQEASKRALEQKRLADLAKEDAIKQKKVAEDATISALVAEDKAQKLRMLSISKSMAVTSTTIRRDTAQKGNVALKAYQIAEEFGDDVLKEHNPEVYTGLYNALKTLKGSDFNRLKGHTQAVRSVVFNNRDNRLYTSGSDGRVLAWDMSKANPEPKELLKREYIIRSLAVSDNDRWLVVGSEQSQIELIDLKNPDLDPGKLEGHKDRVWAFSFLSDNRLLSTGADTTVMSWNLEENTGVVLFKTEERVLPNALDASEDGRHVVAGTKDGKLLVLDLVDSTKSKTFFQGQSRISSVAISSNGTYVAGGDQTGHVRLWNLKTNKLVMSWLAQRGRISDLEFSKDGTKLASATYSGFGTGKGNVMIWRLEDTDLPPIQLEDFSSEVWTLAFSTDDQNIIVGCKDNLIRVYPLEMSVMANQICGLIDRNMTIDEWQRFVAKDIEYSKTCDDKPEGEGVDEYRKENLRKEEDEE